jgi:hypothetical protein
MAPNLDQVQDTKAADNTATANPLINEVSQALTSDTSKDVGLVDYLKAGQARVNDVFGALQISGTELKGPALLSDNIQSAVDPSTIENSLKGKTPEQVKAIDEAFKKDHEGKGIEEILANRWADRPSDMLQIFQSMHPVEAQAAGKIEETPEMIKAADTKALDSIHKDPEIQAKHDEMVKRAKETMKEPELSKFVGNLDKFEAREANVQHQYEKENEAKGMSPENASKEAEKKAHQQVKDTFDNVEKLLAHNPKAPVSDKDRADLAQQVMKHAAEPGSVSQGRHETCTVAAVESRAYDRDPAQASRVVSEVATTGQYTRPGHAAIKLDPQSLQKQADAAEKHGDDKDNTRDFAGQLFEVTAVNIMLQQKNESTNPPGQLRYEQHKPVAGQTPDDSGERWMDYAKHPAKVMQNDIGIGVYDLAFISKQISPQGSEGTVAITSYALEAIDRNVVEAEFQVHSLNGGKIGDTNDPNWAKKAHDVVDHSALTAKEKAEVSKTIDEYVTQKKIESDTSVVHVHNEQEMKTVLAQLKHDGKLPVIIQVNTENEPFWTDSNGGNAGGAGGEHVVTIADYDEKTGTVKVRNQWDAGSDHDNLSTKQLFDATRQPKHEIEDLTKEVNEAKSSGHRNYVMEIELLRLKREYHQISDPDFEKQVVEMTVEKVRDVHSGKISRDEFDAANREFWQFVSKLKQSHNRADEKVISQLGKDVNAGIKALGYDH